MKFIGFLVVLLIIGVALYGVVDVFKQINKIKDES